MGTMEILLLENACNVMTDVLHVLDHLILIAQAVKLILMVSILILLLLSKNVFIHVLMDLLNQPLEIIVIIVILHALLVKLLLLIVLVVH